MVLQGKFPFPRKPIICVILDQGRAALAAAKRFFEVLLVVGSLPSVGYVRSVIQWHFGSLCLHYKVEQVVQSEMEIM
jgi:hypothetical protein